MKIIYYSPHPYLNLSSPSGYGTHMREMIAAFEKLGHEVYPVIAGGVEIPDVPLSKEDTSRKIISLAKKFIPKIIWETLKDYRLIKFDKHMKNVLLDAIDKVQPDLIYERGNYMQVSGIEAAKEKYIPHYVELNAPYIKERLELQGKSWLTNKGKVAEERIINEADKIFVISTSLKEYFEKEHKIQNPDQIQAIPNAINPAKFVVKNDLVSELKNKLNYNNDEVVIGFVGSILRWHGVDILINAFDQIADDFPESRLLIVGSGEVFEELNELVDQLGRKDRVMFTGNVIHEDVPSYIDLMDITVIAKTNWYCSPIKIFEYAALNKAVIASNHPPVVEVMEAGIHGLIIESNPESLAMALRELLDDPEKRKLIAQSFYDKTMSEHTWDENARRVLDNIG